MNCPVCGTMMRKITPLIFQGEGVESYGCIAGNCNTVLHHKPNVVEEIEFQAMFTVKHGGPKTAEEQQALLEEMVLTYQAVTTSAAGWQVSVSVCTD